LSTKGYTCESLIISGAYCSSFNLTLGIILLCVGALGGVGRYGVNINAMAKKGELYDAVSMLLKKIVEQPTMPDFSAFRGNDEIH